MSVTPRFSLVMALAFSVSLYAEDRITINDQAASAGFIEETIVTADFRESKLMSTAGSISVIDKDVVRQRAAQHLQDILNAVPNVSWAAGASRSRFLQVRGVGDLEQYAEPKYYPAVGIMLDDLELGDAANAGMLFDVEQVEVLRGPQGTRFGASAHAGMVTIKTRAPTQQFEGQLSAGAGNYDSYNLGLVLSGPLSETVSARLAMQQNESDGHIENRQLNRDDTNGYDEGSIRLKVRWVPSETAQYDIGLFVFDSDNGYDTWSLDNERNSYADQPGKDAQETVAITIKGQWQLQGDRELQAVISNSDSDLFYSYDADWVSDDFCITFLCSFGNDTAMEIFDRQRNKSIIDVRLLGGLDNLSKGQGHYVVGLYTSDSSETLDYAYPSFWYGNYSSNSDYDTERFAVYGEYQYAVNDQLTLSAGIRFERFSDDYTDSNGYISDHNFDLTSGEISLEYQWHENTMIYATVARSNKPGGVNVAASSQQVWMSPMFQQFTADKLGFDEEILLNKEVGLKSELLDQKLFLRLALFHTDRDSAQLENWMWDDAAGLWIGYLDGNSDATNYGVELESRFQLNQLIQLFVAVGWLKTEVDNIEAFDLDQWSFINKKNRDQAKSPEYQFNLGAQLAITEQLSARVEVEGQDQSYFGYYHDGKFDSYTLYNASLNWVTDAISISLWGRNLSDEDYAVHGLYFGADPRDNFGAWANMTYEQLAEPRTYGVNVSYSF